MNGGFHATSDSIDGVLGQDSLTSPPCHGCVALPSESHKLARGAVPDDSGLTKCRFNRIVGSRQWSIQLLSKSNVSKQLNGSCRTHPKNSDVVFACERVELRVDENSGNTALDSTDCLLREKYFAGNDFEPDRIYDF